METTIKFILLAFVGQAICGEYFSSNGTKYYFSAPMVERFDDAQRFCHANGMHLASIHTEEENRILLDVIYGKFQPSKPDDHFWTSGTDMGGTDMDFYWAESGHSTLYSNWIAGHPTKGHNGCILLHGAIHKYQFCDEACTSPWFFICQDRLFIPDATKRNMYMNSSFFESG